MNNEIPRTYVHDKALAEEMAYAEKPYQDKALLGRKALNAIIRSEEDIAYDKGEVSLNEALWDYPHYVFELNDFKAIEEATKVTFDLVNDAQQAGSSIADAARARGEYSEFEIKSIFELVDDFANSPTLDIKNGTPSAPGEPYRSTIGSQLSLETLTALHQAGLLQEDNEFGIVDRYVHIGRLARDKSPIIITEELAEALRDVHWALTNNSDRSVKSFIREYEKRS